MPKSETTKRRNVVYQHREADSCLSVCLSVRNKYQDGLFARDMAAVVAARYRNKQQLKQNGPQDIHCAIWEVLRAVSLNIYCAGILRHVLDECVLMFRRVLVRPSTGSAHSSQIRLVISEDGDTKNLRYLGHCKPSEPHRVQIS